MLVCDANFSTLPVVAALQERGYYVACCGSIATDPCHSLADQSFIVDYSDKRALKELVLSFNPDYLVSGCNDVSYLSASWVAEALGYSGFDSYETTQIIHEKYKFRALCKDKNYPSPQYVTSFEQAGMLNFPVLFKPTSSFSGKGIECYQTIEELTAAMTEHTDSGSFVIEEFVEGALFSHSAFIKDGDILVDFFVNEYCTVYPYQVNSSHLASDISPEVITKARDWLKNFCKDLALVDGLVHTQFLSDGQSFSILEVCRRCPGDLYSLLIQKSTDVNYAWLFAAGFTKNMPDKVIGSVLPRYITRHTVSIDYHCVFLGSRLNLDCINYVNFQLKKCGEQLKAAPYDKAGIYFIEHKDNEKMHRLTEGMRDCVDIESIAVRKSV